MIKDLIKAKTPEELVEKLNADTRNIKATQPMQCMDGQWIAFIYIEDVGQVQPPSQLDNEKPQSYSSDAPTDKQIGFLKANNKPIPAGLTKQEAIALIGDIKNAQQQENPTY